MATSNVPPLAITSANSTFTLTIAGLYDAPQYIQGYATDDMFTTDAVENKEIKLGADGNMSVGWVPTLTPQEVMLQADSVSGPIFDAWKAAEDASQGIYYANGIITIPGIGQSYTLIKGVLRSYISIPRAAKTLEPRRFGLTWNTVVVNPIAPLVG